MEKTLLWWFIGASKHNVLKFPEYSDSCCDTSEINILENILKKFNFNFFSKFVPISEYIGFANNINQELIKYDHVHFLLLSTMRNWKRLPFRLSWILCKLIKSIFPTNNYCSWIGKRFLRRSSEQSIVPSLLSVEQKRSPHILPESRAF